MSRLALVLLLVAWTSCKGDLGEECYLDRKCKSGICGDRVCVSGEAGAPCRFNGECLEDKGLHCFEKVCREPGGDGARCDLDTECQSHLKCGDHVCLSAEAARVAKDKATARAEAEVRKQQADKEARLLAESGVVAESKIEHATNPPGAGSRVRVVKTTAKNTAFAACRTDERLIGGGCRSTIDTRASYPSDHGEQDTVGARWNCEIPPSDDVTAYALCAKLP